MRRRDLAGLIDHALLRPVLEAAELERHCREAIDLGLRSVCLYPAHLEAAARVLRGTKVLLCAVIAFPHGSTTPLGKTFEALEAWKMGAVELDIVLNLSAVASGRRAVYEEEVRSLMERTPECRHKFILETGLFDRAVLRPVLRVMNQRRPAFVKTSTGVNGPGATPEAVAWLRSELHESIGIKAAGGIRTREQALSLVEAGATRIGTSAAPDLLRQPGCPGA